MDDSLKFEKERAIARFNRVRAAMRLLKFVQLAIVVAAVAWFTPANVRSTGVALIVSLSTCACNHHVVFFVGNAIIVSLFVLCRHSATSPAVDLRGNVYHDDYVKYSEVGRATPSPPQEEEEDHVATPGAEFGVEFDGDRQIFGAVCDEETAEIFAKCDEVGRVIEEETRKIRWFERTQSEKLRREFAVKRELRRSETEARRETVSSEASDIDNLSSEEFRRRVDAFIEQHRRRREVKLEEDEIVDRD